MNCVEEIESLDLVLTCRCDLRCSYCYQDHSKSGRMSWDTLRRSIDLLLQSRRTGVRMAFTGGEPLLEFALMRRAITYAEERRPRDKRLGWCLTTNGLHLTEGVASFLAEHDFDLRLSFDGVPAAQDHRGRGTFPVLDRLLDRLSRDHPGFYRRNVTICATLSPPTVPHLADSVAYFLRKRVGNIALSPAIGSHRALPTAGMPAAGQALRDELERQFARIHESCLRHLAETCEVPLLAFRREVGEVPHEAEDRTMCNIMRGPSPAVSADGEVYGCMALAGDFREISSPPLRRRLEEMRLGQVGDPGFGARYAGLAQAAERAQIFHHKRRKYSSFGHCCDCRHFARCQICPVSSAHLPGNADPHRIDDFACAFNLASLQVREQFPLRQDG